jgi:hypothetical protein
MMITQLRGLLFRAMELHTFRLELPSETTHAEAHNAGRHHIEQTLKPRQYYDYRWWASRPHPTMSGMSIFSYNYRTYTP